MATTKPTKQTILAALEAGDITALVLAHHDNSTAAKLTYFNRLGLFRFRAMRDTDARLSDLLGDCYNPAANPDVPREQLKKEERRERARIASWGVWGVITEVRETSTSKWHEPNEDEPNSLWGLVGGDFIGSGYDQEQMVSAEDWFDKRELSDPQAVLVKAAKEALLMLRAVTARYPELIGEVQPRAKNLFNALGAYDLDGPALGSSPATPARAAPPLRFDGHGLNLNLPGHQGERFATLVNRYKPNSSEGTEEDKAMAAEVFAILGKAGAVLFNY